MLIRWKNCMARTVRESARIENKEPALTRSAGKKTVLRDGDRRLLAAVVCLGPNPTRRPQKAIVRRTISLDQAT
jgi:hypothetical protein